MMNKGIEVHPVGTPLLACNGAVSPFNLHSLVSIQKANILSMCGDSQHTEVSYYLFYQKTHNGRNLRVYLLRLYRCHCSFL